MGAVARRGGQGYYRAEPLSLDIDRSKNVPPLMNSNLERIWRSAQKEEDNLEAYKSGAGSVINLIFACCIRLPIFIRVGWGIHLIA